MGQQNKPVDLQPLEDQIIATSKKRSLIYDDIAEIVEYITKIKSIRFGMLGIYDYEDIAQEIRLKCHRILPQFQPGKTTAFNYFGRCADNLLRDIRRRHTLRKTNVCSRCVYYRNKECFLYGKHPKECERYKIYLINKERKEGITKMISDPGFAWHTQQAQGFMFDQERHYQRAISEIRNILPSGLILPFDMVLANSGIVPEIEDQLFATVKAIINYSIDW